MDTLAALALATEPPDESFLDGSSPEIYKGIIFPKMVKHIVGQAFYQIIIMLILVFDGKTKE